MRARTLVIGAICALVLCMSDVSSGQSKSEPDWVGCISRAPNGALRFQSSRSRKTYLISSDSTLAGLTANELVELKPASATSGDTVRVQSFRVLSGSCTSTALSVASGQGVPGKTGAVASAVPITDVSTAAETTPGFQTELGLEDQRKNTSQQRGAQESRFAPLFPEQAGQSALAADRNAQAAARAELYPGATLGVETKSSPSAASTASKDEHSSPTTARPPSQR